MKYIKYPKQKTNIQEIDTVVRWHGKKDMLSQPNVGSILLLLHESRNS